MSSTCKWPTESLNPGTPWAWNHMVTREKMWKDMGSYSDWLGSGSGQRVRLLGLALVFYVSKGVLGVYQRPCSIQVRCQNSPVPSKSEKLLFKAGIQMFDMCLLKVGLLGEDLRGKGV